MSEPRYQRPTSQSEMAESLIQRFLAGGDSATQKLPSERALALEYGVSRPFAREVLAGLSRQGYIETIPGRGAFIRRAEMTDIARGLRVVYGQNPVTPRMLAEARLGLESLTAELAATRATPAQLESLRAALESFEAATDLVTRARSDIAFHSIVAKAAQNPALEIMFGAISALTFEMILRSLGDPRVAGEGAPLHKTIYEAIRDGDAVAARDAMAQHMHVADHTFGADIDAPLDTIANDTIKRILGPTYSLEGILSDTLREFNAIGQP
jgi:GntR family transcriptional repressor for pyruvate dehydrogenase complex